jgi:DNA-binding NarL/FixJ family response regulator
VSRHGSPSHERLRWAIEQRHSRLALVTAAELPRVPARDALALSLLLLEDEARAPRLLGGMGRRRPVVLVAGDQPLLVRGAAVLLDRVRDIDAIYAGSAARARRLLGGATDVLAWAGDNLDAGAVDALRDARQACPALGLCVVARRVDAVALERLVGEGTERLALSLHAERFDARDLVELIHSVLRGRSTVDMQLIRHLAARQEAQGESELTASEREVMELVAAGLRNREIARRLWKSEKTVEKHVGRVFQKLGLPPGSTGHLDRRVVATRMYLARAAAQQSGDAFEPPPSSP